MSRHDRARLDDIAAALAAVEAHRRRGDLADGLVFDAPGPQEARVRSSA